MTISYFVKYYKYFCQLQIMYCDHMDEMCMNDEDYLICNDSFGLIHMKSLRLLATNFGFYDSILRSTADFKYFSSKKDKREEAME